MEENKPKVRKTSIPAAILISESIFLHAWCQDDRLELTIAGVDWGTVESLPSLCEQCSSLYAKSCVEKKELAAYKRRLRKLFNATMRVRSMIADKIRKAQKFSGSVKKLPVYHRRRTYAEIIQDLSELAGLCGVFKPQLDAIGFKSSRADAVNKCALLRQRDYSAVRKMGIDTREQRLEYLDAYRTLMTTAQQIREKALAYFPGGSPRRAGYVSQYRKGFYTSAS